jgi:hypothetical protein
MAMLHYCIVCCAAKHTPLRCRKLTTTFSQGTARTALQLELQKNENGEKDTLSRRHQGHCTAACANQELAATLIANKINLLHGRLRIVVPVCSQDGCKVGCIRSEKVQASTEDGESAEQLLAFFSATTILRALSDFVAVLQTSLPGEPRIVKRYWRIETFLSRTHAANTDIVTLICAWVLQDTAEATA